MNTLALVSFVGLVALSSASRCCAPPQLERSEYIEGREMMEGKMIPVKATARTAYDATNERLMTKSTITRGQTTETKHILSDYKQGYQYTVVEGACTKSRLTGPFPAQCIPDNASKGIPMYFGAGDKRILVTDYIVKDADMISSLLVTENCTPFSNTTTCTSGKTPYVVAIAYNGTTLGIADPAVFDIPPSCSHEHTVPDVQEKLNSQVCCVPKQFESPGGALGLIDVNGKALKQTISMMTSYDSINKKTVTKSTTIVENYPPTITVELKDYAAGKQYEVKNGVCNKGPLTTTFPDQCTPANATYSPIVMGTGPHAVKGRIYNYMYSGINMTFIVTEDCVPLTEMLNGHSVASVEYWIALGYTGLTTGIKDPSVFNVPASCGDDMDPLAPVVQLG